MTYSQAKRLLQMTDAQRDVLFDEVYASLSSTYVILASLVHPKEMEVLHTINKITARQTLKGMGL